MHHGHHGRRRGFRGRRFPSAEQWLEQLEEYQRDLEQETANVAELVRRLRENERKSEPVAP